ncbi:lanthionine synthetase C family protein [Roseivirga misakiensis]|uniref:Lantibiotic biosynthesis protein n=1 Tax=Roseivirga misakiensis TaxID=1563681 RepID=A0A1E5T6H1_9BACT|nr:lanthionine synthetase C family protein [Roseivirga misakiensis]OEK06897.1 hypothetical protein BFP71_04375 [Roseivirga misakiensis]
MLQKKDLEKKLEEIAQALETKQMESPHLGVLAGISGVAMFFFYYAKYKRDNHYGTVGNRVLEECLNRISNGYSFPTYCTGIAGVGWVFEHLSENNFIEIKNDKLLPDIEDHLYHKMKERISIGHYDFLHGAIGYGVYFLKRYKNTQSEKLKIKYEAYLKELLEGLKETSEKDKSGIKWSSEIKKGQSPEIVYNLSLSHGMSSIVNFLARTYEFDEFQSLAYPLLKGSISYILSQEKSIEHSLFPSTISKNSKTVPVESRLSWCYGDLGVGLSLHKASQILKDQELSEDASRILLHSTNRKGLKACGVVDASPCHGAFGLAQIYGTMFKLTKLKALGKATDYWVSEGLKLAIYKDGYAGFKQQRWNDSPVNEVNLLEGIAGIGLCIISYLSDFEPNWEESLMIK